MDTRTKILVGILVIVSGIAGYVFFGGEESSEAPGLSTNVPTGVEEETAAGKKFLSILLRLKELNIDRRIFEDPAFVSLQDYGVVLSPETPGRKNPFAPLGEGGGFSAALPLGGSNASTSARSSSSAGMTAGSASSLQQSSSASTGASSVQGVNRSSSATNATGSAGFTGGSATTRKSTAPAPASVQTQAGNGTTGPTPPAPARATSGASTEGAGTLTP